MQALKPGRYRHYKGKDYQAELSAKIGEITAKQSKTEEQWMKKQEQLEKLAS